MSSLSVRPWRSFRVRTIAGAAGRTLGRRWDPARVIRGTFEALRPRQMEFRILGALDVVEGERSLPLGGARQRALLAILLTRANEVVSRDTLVDELWGGEPPDTARNTLQGYISHLRKAVGADVLVTRAPGYVVRVEPDQLDLHRFERLLDEARTMSDAGGHDEAGRLLREALKLWRGPALADFAYEPFAQGVIARLEELRLVGLERRIAADLAVGRHSELVGELELLISKQPLREGLRGQLMVALYRSGRQAEALEAYQDARRALVDELGIDPGPSLQRLERAILRQDPSLDLQGVARPVSGSVSDDDPEAEQPVAEGSILVLPLETRALAALIAIAEPLARRPPRELILVRLIAPAENPQEATAALQEQREALLTRGIASRAAAFTSVDPGEDAVLMASEQQTDLILRDVPVADLERGLPEDAATMLASSPCDVGLVVIRDDVPELAPDRPVLVPFSGAEHDWTAIEIGAWIARAHGISLGLLGTAADPDSGRRDASRLLARASLMVQQVVSVATEPVLVPAGDEAITRACSEGGLIVMGLSPRWRQEGLGHARQAIVRNAKPPVVLIKRGLRPGGIAPRDSLTRFTWTMSSGAGKRTGGPGGPPAQA